MKTNEEIKKVVKEKYGQIVKQSKEQNESSCCGATTDCCTTDYTIFSENYTKLEGYNPDADLGLGCGLPTEFALIKKGDTILDLGSGAGNDCFIARELTGTKGKVIGLDFTEEMIDKARINAHKLGLNNVEFRYGEIEKMPIGDNSIDVVVSNCVMNLVPDKEQAFTETFRVIKPGGHFSISDIVLKGELPEAIMNDAIMYAGCVAGALQKNDYLNQISKAGFADVKIQKEKLIKLPDELLKNYLDDSQLRSFKEQKIGIFSITVYAKKPECKCKSEGDCC